ncbi:ABC transporter permease [Janthinobacterium sp. UMAB-60]|uniref:ABC transporter permease n=1 Tax=Janthinobacterium sp. UMAB-60 TaxID=1365365 RepID=UPI001C57D0BB|nr:ABC transporter permease [Janthinobacterium sp. UMAB-60]
MHNVLDSFCLALASIRSHGFRSVLTMLGIIIGVASVIAIVALSQALGDIIASNFKGLGSNSMSIRSLTTPEQALQGRFNRLTFNDYRHIVRHVEDISDIAPSFSPFGDYGTAIKHASTTVFARVSAVTPNYQLLSQATPQYGRYISNDDVATHRRVCVIGKKLRDKLHLPNNPIGQFIELGGQWFKVVGVTEPHAEAFGGAQDDQALIPFSTGQSLAADPAQIDLAVTFNVIDSEQLAAVQERTASLLRQLHRIQPGDKDDFEIFTAVQLQEIMSRVVGSMTLVLTGIVGISLLVGGIGIMNVMLISVTERTREIGICKALGARRHHILMQFLMEAAMLSLLGGAIGVVAGYLLSLLASALIPALSAPSIPWWAMTLALGFSTLVGLLFGILPAAKAANLDPIEALRFE